MGKKGKELAGKVIILQAHGNGDQIIFTILGNNTVTISSLLCSVLKFNSLASQFWALHQSVDTDFNNTPAQKEMLNHKALVSDSVNLASFLNPGWVWNY